MTSHRVAADAISQREPDADRIRMMPCDSVRNLGVRADNGADGSECWLEPRELQLVRRRGGPDPCRAIGRPHGESELIPVEVVTDLAATYPIVLEKLLAAAWHHTEQDANKRVEADHGRLKAQLRPMRGLKQDRNARVIIAGHAFVQNVRRGHYDLAVEEPVIRQLTVAFGEHALAI